MVIVKRRKESFKGLIIRALLEAESDMTALELRDIIKTYGREMSREDVSSLLSVLCSSDLGYFINRKVRGRMQGFVLVPEVRKLSAEALYGLTLKRGPSAYDLNQCVADHPELLQYMGEKTGAGRSHAGKPQSQQKEEPTPQPQEPTASTEISEPQKEITPTETKEITTPKPTTEIKATEAPKTLPKTEQRHTINVNVNHHLNIYIKNTKKNKKR
jgi:hypothetical protein